MKRTWGLVEVEKAIGDFIDEIDPEPRWLEDFFNLLQKEGVRIPSSNLLLQGIKEFETSFRQDAREQAERKITDIIGELAERFGATSGWLFLVTGDTLTSIVAYNTPKNNLRLGIHEGVVGHVARSRRGYVAFDVRSTDECPFYKNVIPATRSEIAVPILTFGVDGREELLAVLNLESKQLGAFLPVHLGELQAAASRLVLHILVLSTAERYPFAWHPDVHGWGLSQLLDRFCFRVSSRTKAQLRSLLPSCTIWHCDRQKKRLYVRGTSGFSYEYYSQRSLPQDSFTGHVADYAKGAVKRCSLREASEFRNKRKAVRMGIEQIVLTPIFKSNEAQAAGVLNLYFFEEDIRRRKKPVKSAFPDSVVAQLADRVGCIIEQAQDLQRRAAVAYLNSRLAEETTTIRSAFEIIRDTLMECLEGDACSIFCSEDSKLVCVATTGLVRDGQRVENCNDATYDANEDWGLTIALFKAQLRCLRKNDVSDSTERVGLGTTPEPSGKFRETFASGYRSHQRFLGVTVRDGDKKVGVIRVIRSPMAKPFILADESLIELLADSSKRTFLRWKEEDKEANETTLPASLYLPLSDRAGLLAAQRLLTPVPGYFTWNYRQVKALLQDLVYTFRECGALLANVRFVSTNDSHKEYLQLYAFHSSGSNEPPDEQDFPPPTSDEGSIGFETIQSRQVLTFTRECPLFKPIHQDSAQVRSGVCVPIKFLAAGHLVRGVLCLDFDRTVSFEARHILTIVHAAQKVLIMCSDNRFDDKTSYDSRDLKRSLTAFMQSTVASLDLGWANLELRSNGSRAPVASLGRRNETVVEKLPRIKGFGDLGVKADIEVGAFLLPVYWRHLEAGVMSAGFEDAQRQRLHEMGFSLEGQLMRSIISTTWSLWTRFVAQPFWDVRFTQDTSDTMLLRSKGLNAWSGRISFSGSELFTDPIRLPLLGSTV